MHVMMHTRLYVLCCCNSKKLSRNSHNNALECDKYNSWISKRHFRLFSLLSRQLIALDKLFRCQSDTIFRCVQIIICVYILAKRRYHFMEKQEIDVYSFVNHGS